MRKRWKIWVGIAIPTLFLVVVGLAYRPVVVNGSSMLPTLRPRQVVLMDRHRDEGLHRGDVVVLDFGGEMLIKRVYAIGGDSLEMAQMANGAQHLIATSHLTPAQIWRHALARPWEVRIVRVTVPSGYVYVLGDNLGASADSREFGPVPESWVMGRVVKPDEALRHLPKRLRTSLPRVYAREPR